jgi:hypothetical protein
MSDVEDVKTIEYDEAMRKIRDEVAKKLFDYRKTINFMASDAPISILCLPSVIENILTTHGFIRVYDLFGADFTKVKGLGVIRTRELTTRLDQFFSMF